MNKAVQIAVLPPDLGNHVATIVALDEKGKIWMAQHGYWEALPLLPEDKCLRGQYCAFPTAHEGDCTTTKG